MGWVVSGDGRRRIEINDFKKKKGFGFVGYPNQNFHSSRY